MVRLCSCFAAAIAVMTVATVRTAAVGRYATSKAGPAMGWLVKLNAEERGEIARKCPLGIDDEGALSHLPSLVDGPMPSATNGSDHDERAEQRLYDGRLASRGLFLSSAVMVNPRDGYPYHAMCGASLISPRHLLTAAHCVVGTVAGRIYPIRLLAGGVCTDAVPSEACPSGDMVELEIEFAIKEYFFSTNRDKRLYIRKPYDIAIIQLKKPLSVYLPEERAEFACLPHSNDADLLPTSLSMWGWGLRGGGEYETPTIHQRYLVGVVSRPLPGWTGDLLTTKRQCNLPPTPTFCLFSPSGAPAVGLPGDSGSGVVVYRRRSLTNVLYGVLTSGSTVFYALTPNGKEQLREISVIEATAHYLDDLCYYLGHCANSNGLATRLQLGSVMMTQPRSALPPIAPFRMVSLDEQAKNDEYCAELANQPISPLTWAVGLVELPAEGGDPERVLCTATHISSAHLVASRRCVVDYLRGRKEQKANEAKVAPSRLRLIASEYEFCYRPSASGPTCAAVREGRYRVLVLRPEFIAWRHVSAGRHNSTEVSYTNISTGVVINVHDYRPPYTMDSDLAIIQLGAEDAARLAASDQAIRPACLERVLLDDYGGDDTNEKRSLGALAYGVSIDAGVHKGVAWLRGRVGRQWDGMPSDVLRVERDSEGEAKYPSAWERGAGLLDSRSHRLLGLLLDRSQKQRFYYVHLWEYAGVFCTFLNLGCRPNSAGVSYLDNRIPAFDRFVYMDDD